MPTKTRRTAPAPVAGKPWTTAGAILTKNPHRGAGGAGWRWWTMGMSCRQAEGSFRFFFGRPQNPRNSRVNYLQPAPVARRPAQPRFHDGGQPERALGIRGEREV